MTPGGKRRKCPLDQPAFVAPPLNSPVRATRERWRCPCAVGRRLCSAASNSMTGQFGTSSLCRLVLPWVTARGKCRAGSDRGLGGPRTPSSSSHGVNWTDCHDPIRHRFDGDKYEVYELQKVRASEGQGLGARQVERWRQALGPRGNGFLDTCRQ